MVRTYVALPYRRGTTCVVCNCACPATCAAQMQSAVSVRVLWVVLIGSLIRLGGGRVSGEESGDQCARRFVPAPWPVFLVDSEITSVEFLQGLFRRCLRCLISDPEGEKSTWNDVRCRHSGGSLVGIMLVSSGHSHCLVKALTRAKRLQGKNAYRGYLLASVLLARLERLTIDSGNTTRISRHHADFRLCLTYRCGFDGRFLPWSFLFPLSIPSA